MERPDVGTGWTKALIIVVIAIVVVVAVVMFADKLYN